jgi:glycosyltransferase involved in cell wall biosynthesis
MKIAFYAPFKPLDHPHPSGDATIARGLVDYLKDQGHDIQVQSRLRTRWIYFKPWLWPWFVFSFARIIFRFNKKLPDVWLTYHTYYKAPDVIGPWICRLFGLKYLVFQGIYSTKHKRRIKTWPGFILNRSALLKADHVFTNKTVDLKNLTRLLPEEQVTYVTPGLDPAYFKSDREKAEQYRSRWGIKKGPLLLTAAMFRNDVKTRGLVWLIETLGRLVEKKIAFHLVIAGSGKMEARLKKWAEIHLPECHTFAGRIAKKQMPGFYSAGDLFVFPGIGESLGMVFLEAQSCGLPVIAFNNGGIPEVVKHQSTGFLTPMYDRDFFLKQVERLINDRSLRMKMGRQAMDHVRGSHRLVENYQIIDQVIKRLAR